MTAGPDGFRERDHNTQAALIGHWSFLVHSFVGSTDHHLLQLFLHPGIGEPVRDRGSLGRLHGRLLAPIRFPGAIIAHAMWAILLAKTTAASLRSSKASSQAEALLFPGLA